MLSREFNLEKDYDEVARWWVNQGWPILPPNMLTGKGFIVETDKDKVAAGWVFTTNCPIYIMEWVVGNPKVDWEKRQDGIKTLIDDCSEWAKQDGASFILTMTSNKRFIEKLKDSKFSETDKEMTHLMRRL